MTSHLETVRNIVFVGHPSSGKTTLVDALAFATGAAQRKGSVSDKTSSADTEPEEHEKGHRLQMAVVQAQKDGFSWNFLDTPGYPEFIADCNSATFASDLVVGVASCGSGATYNLRKKMEAAAQQKRGRAIVVTHIDAENADFDAVVEQLRKRIGDTCVPILFPDQSG